MKFSVRSSAKINLSLDILGRLPNGYHQLASVVHCVGIWDEIEVEIGGNDLVFACNRADLGSDDNLCVRAVKIFQNATKSDFGAKIFLEKAIPDGAGLGGGSGNAAAILAVCNRAFDFPLSLGELENLGAKLGADVPLFLRGGAVLMEGIGEILSVLTPIEGAVLIIKPSLSLATPSVYGAWDHGEFRSELKTGGLLEIWPSGDLKLIGASLGNDLECAAAQISLVPTQIVEFLCDLTPEPLGAQMSGSGSACFALFPDENEALNAQRNFEASVAKDVLISQSRTFVAPLVARGVEIAQKPE